jgi:GntR family transcriptional regulator of arabinose operon
MKAAHKKYMQVKDYILRGIREGRYLAGHRIPTEEEIMRLLGYSRSPVRHAMAELEQAGYITKIHGSGSYVKHGGGEESVEIYTLLYADTRGIEKDFIHGMRQAVNRSQLRDLRLVLKRPGRDTEEMIAVLQSLPTQRTAGVIVVPILSPDRALNRRLAANLRKLDRRGMIVVQLDRFLPEYEGHCVMCDHRRGAYEMTEHLLGSGHRRIAVLYEHPENSSIRLRLEGVRAALAEHDLSLPTSVQFSIPVEKVAGRGGELIERLRQGRITAAFCFESELALELYRVCAREGLAVPQELSLCSFDDHGFVNVREGFLTAVVQPLEQIGYYAVDLVLQNLQAADLQPVRMALQPSIVKRQSVAAL